MQFACSSTAFDEAFRAGSLTQLEWLDHCAHDLLVDGIACDLRHFPRTDTDYLAQVKKMAVDLGLTVAALRHDGFFAADQPHMEQAFEIALAIGAPLLCTPLPAEVAMSWTQVQAQLAAATQLAKRHNVTLAVRNAPHSYGASSHDLKRVSKEADSAWLRYGPDFGALDAASQASELVAKTVIVWSDLGAQASDELRALLAPLRGFLVLDAGEGNASVPEMQNALRRWRGAFEADRT